MGGCAQVGYADWTYSVSDGFGRVKLIHAKKPKPKPVFHLTSSPPKDAIVFGLSEDDLIAAVQTRIFDDFISHMSVTLLEILFQHELRVGPQIGGEDLRSGEHIPKNSLFPQILPWSSGHSP